MKLAKKNLQRASGTVKLCSGGEYWNSGKTSERDNQVKRVYIPWRPNVPVANRRHAYENKREH